jgi:hypothetical protein
VVRSLTAVITSLSEQITGLRLTPVIFPVAQQHPFRFVKRRPPGLLALLGVAPHLDVASPCSPGGGAVARLPGQRHRARLPSVVQAAFGRPGYTSHPVSRTHIRESVWLGLLGTDEAFSVHLGRLCRWKLLSANWAAPAQVDSLG